MVTKLVGGARFGVASGTSAGGGVGAGAGAAALRSAGGEQAASRATTGKQRRLVRIMSSLRENMRFGEA